MILRGPRSLVWKLGFVLVLIQVMVALGLGWFIESSADGAADATLMRIRMGIVISAMLAIMATLLALWYIARRSAARIARLTDVARQYAAGRLDYRIGTALDGPLAPLHESLTDMARQLALRIDELEAGRNEQQAILQSMSNAVLAIDRDQHLLTANAAAERLLHFDLAAARGRLLQEIIRQPALNEFISAALAEDIEKPVELTLTGDARQIVRIVAEPMNNADGDRTGILLILDDITELRRLESMRSDFAANVSHELRTPITNIKGYVETLLEVGGTDPAQTRRFLEIIHDNSHRLSAIIEDMMALTRFEQSDTQDDIERIEVPVRHLLSSVVSQFQQRAGKKNIALVVEAPEDLTGRLHAQLMEQAVGNLVSNAINYSEPGTTIRLRAEPRMSPDQPSRSEMVITVVDEGPGIAPEHLPRLFERLYRVDKARSREMGGTGLGLAIVKHIALLHEGRAQVESTVGRGSTFRIVIPA